MALAALPYYVLVEVVDRLNNTRGRTSHHRDGAQRHVAAAYALYATCRAMRDAYHAHDAHVLRTVVRFGGLRANVTHRLAAPIVSRGVFDDDTATTPERVSTHFLLMAARAGNVGAAYWLSVRLRTDGRFDAGSDEGDASGDVRASPRVRDAMRWCVAAARGGHGAAWHDLATYYVAPWTKAAVGTTVDAWLCAVACGNPDACADYARDLATVKRSHRDAHAASWRAAALYAMAGRRRHCGEQLTEAAKHAYDAWSMGFFATTAPRGVDDDVAAADVRWARSARLDADALALLETAIERYRVRAAADDLFHMYMCVAHGVLDARTVRNVTPSAIFGSAIVRNHAVRACAPRNVGGEDDDVLAAARARVAQRWRAELAAAQRDVAARRLWCADASSPVAALGRGGYEYLSAYTRQRVFLDWE